MIFIDSEGATVYEKAFNLTIMQETPVSQNLSVLLSTDDFLWGHAHTERSIASIGSLPEAPLLIVSQPILTSQSEGPIRGALIMGRYLDSEEIEKLQETLYLPLIVTPFDELEVQPASQELYYSSFFDNVPIFTHPLNADYIAGYAVIKDVYGNNSFILRVDTSQDFYKQAVTSVVFFILALTCSSIILGALTVFVVERGVLSRIHRLAFGVKKWVKAKIFLNAFHGTVRTNYPFFLKQLMA